MSQDSMSLGVVSLGVGIDTARYGHQVSFLDEQKRTAAKSFYFTESAEGYQQLQAALTNGLLNLYVLRGWFLKFPRTPGPQRPLPL